ncbi:hypothetical protein, partial [Xanthomonas phaseoli]|uniref:hypothetical protein n=1 Tax=Xanthomonas phaseoli TaxID=1985254 RepID=UPI001EE66C08
MARKVGDVTQVGRCNRRAPPMGLAAIGALPACIVGLQRFGLGPANDSASHHAGPACQAAPLLWQ